MKCPSCRGTMKKGQTTMPHELGRNKVVVVQDIPALVCAQCGDSFIEPAILKKVETLLNTVEKSGMTIGFIEYWKAA
jgi:YgiT-type zinc finger domain-containing protein